MMRTSFLIREINGSRLPSMVSSMMMQRRARSVEAYASIQNGGVTKEEDAEVQEARPTKDIPGPRAWPLIGNMFRFMPYIGNEILSFYSLFLFRKCSLETTDVSIVMDLLESQCAKGKS